MIKRPSRFKQQDVTRALKAAVAAGIEIARVQIDTDGNIVIVAGKFGDDPNTETENEWDQVMARIRLD